ncbi:MAG TPA: serine/threonine-protein kinase, partial [Polyangiaceae bacterium]|nr:serine/threonine-protein kinase [Polyangiaceae bacterium]
FYDFGATADGTLYIAMEFVSGKPLADVVQEGPMAADRVIKIMRQVCGVLDEAHLQGVIHRDLKPENIVLTNRAGETDFVKLLDFGIAARTESADAQKEQKLTQQGMVLGTPPYMSPEQFTGKALDARSDVYSLGVMTYEMLAGRLPFDADTPWQWATQHMSVQPIPFEVSAPAKNIPDGMRKAILKALSKNKEDREPSARDYFTELSDGGRVTVESIPDVGGTTGTAAMAQVPDFSPPAAPMMMNPKPMGGAPPVVGLPPSPMTSGRGNKSGGGKGLVIGLGAVGAILLVSIVVLATQSMGNKTEDAPITPLGGGAAGSGAKAGNDGVTTLDPLIPTTSPPPTAGSVAPPPGSSTGTALPPVEPVKPPTTNTGAGTKPPPAAPATGAKACDACIAAATSGNASGAAANFSRCDDAAKKAQCSLAVRNGAPGAARQAALNGNCPGAKAIIAAAQSLGASSPKLASALTGSSCK